MFVLCMVVFCVDFLMLLEILWALEGLVAYFADVRFQRSVDWGVLMREGRSIGSRTDLADGR